MRNIKLSIKNKEDCKRLLIIETKFKKLHSMDVVWLDILKISNRLWFIPNCFKTKSYVAKKFYQIKYRCCFSSWLLLPYPISTMFLTIFNYTSQYWGFAVNADDKIKPPWYYPHSLYPDFRLPNQFLTPYHQQCPKHFFEESMLQISTFSTDLKFGLLFISKEII